MDILTQIGLAAAYYAGLLLLVRLAGKRLAGQTTTFDLLVLITLGVVLQNAALGKGTANALVFIVTVFTLHRLQALACARSDRFRTLLRGKPKCLVLDGHVLWDQLEAEALSQDELLAGLRKLGFRSPREVKAAYIEETGHITAIGHEAH